MSPRFPWALGLLLLGIAMAAGPASAGDRTLAVDDILRLHAAGLSDDIIISEIVVTNTVFVLEVDDILRLQDAGLSEHLLQFMVDTARPETPSSDEETVAPDTTDTGQTATGEEQHAYVVQEPSTHFYVGLNWGYPSWWYGYYWSDYWYYDCGYYPWYVSWSYPCGSWYPSWYYGGCGVPAGWGYHYNYCSNHYAGWDSWNSWNQYGTTPYNQGLSQHKYKLPGGSSGKLLYADAGLRTRDLSRVTTASSKTVLRSSPKELALDSHGKLAGDVRRSVRSTGKAPLDGHGDSGLRRSTRTAAGHAVGDGRPVRPVRKPAAVDRPVHKVSRQTSMAPKGTADVVRQPAGSTVKQAPSGAPARGQSKVGTGHAPHGSKSGGARSYGSRSGGGGGKSGHSGAAGSRGGGGASRGGGGGGGGKGR